MARKNPETKIEPKKKIQPKVAVKAALAPEMELEPQVEIGTVTTAPAVEMKVEEQQLISLKGILSKPSNEAVTKDELNFVNDLVKANQEEGVELKKIYNALSRRFHVNYRVPTLEECLKQSQGIAPSSAELLAQERRSMVKRSMF